MTAFLNRLHNRIGDLWWYSAMIFVACRSGDVIQAFIGLWLVPKYVGPQELGAVLPLQQLTGLFTVPLAILTTVFAKYVNTYATRGELGKVKSFIRDVLFVSILVFVICIAVAYLLIPHFYVRLKVVSGMLTVLVLASGFAGNLGALLGAAQQGLKQFKMMSIQTLISAPIRLVTLLVAMPFRPLSGYLLGQTTPSACTSTLAAFSLRKGLRSVPADPTWRRDLPEIWRYLWPVAVCTAFSTLFSTIILTIYRQRLPEIESSAYYLITRLAEISSFVGSSMLAVLVPLASEAHEQGTDKFKILLHTVLTTIGSGLAFALVFFLAAKPLFCAIPTWKIYANYAYLLPVQTLYTCIVMSAGIIAAYEMACRRFGAAALSLGLNFLLAIFLVSFSGADFFQGILPDTAISAMKAFHIATLPRMTWLMLIFSIVQLICLLPITGTHHRNLQ